MNKHDIPRYLGQAATNKVLWAHTGVNTPASDRYLNLAIQAETGIIGTPSADNEQIIAKVALAMDWSSEWATPAFKALMQSIIADLEGEPDTSAQAVTPPQPAPINGSAHAQPAKKSRAATPAIARRERIGFMTDSIQIDGRAKPILVHGTLYPSIIAAIRATGLSAANVRAIGNTL